MAQDNFDPLIGPAVLNSDGLRRFTDELMNKFVGKMVEIYIGDQAETLDYADNSQHQNATIFGRIVEVMDRFVILDCLYVDKRTNEVAHGNLVYINLFQIRAMSEVNDTGSLDDIFLNSKDVSRVRKYLHLQSKYVKAKK
jgi:hypothetical protein